MIGLFYFFANLFGATKIPMGVLRLGTLRIREKIISIEMGCSDTLYNCRIKILFSRITPRIIVKNLEIILNEEIGIDQDFEKKINRSYCIDTDK